MIKALTVELETEQFVRLEAEAERRGVSAGELASQLLTQHLPATATPSDTRAWSGLSAASFARDWASVDDEVYDRLRRSL